MTASAIAMILCLQTPAPAAQDLNLLVPDGLQVRTWAESPLFYNPTAMDVDERGALWVTEAVNYRKWGGRNPGREHAEGDRVMVLRDTDGDGRADSSVVFAQGPELVSPLGICVLAPGRVLVSCSPDALLYVDEDGDDVADRHEVFLGGFGGHNHDHGLHSFVHGPVGGLYAAVGNAGPHLVEDRAGWQLRSGSAYVGGGEFTADNKPGLVSADGRLWTGGLALRVGADGRGLGVVAHNFRNNYEVALDAFGNLFVSDNDDDGNRGCRTLWAMEGGNYGYFSADGSRFWQADRRPGQSTARAHWHQDDPGVAPAGTINGAGGPTGVCVYEGAWLAPWIEGAVLNADAGAGVVYAHVPRLVGAGYELEPGWLIRGSQGRGGRSADWFRPSDVCVGLDGSVFVADWYDPGVGGHLAGDAEAYGRILRITPAQSEAPPDATSVLPAEWQSFFSPAPSARASWLGRHEGRGDELVEALLAALGEGVDARHHARILFHLASLGTQHVSAIQASLESADPELRIAALRALRHTGAPLLETLASLTSDESPAVRREVLLTLQHHQDAEPWADWMVELARGFDGSDRHYLEAFGLAAHGREEQLYPRLAAELGDTPARWSERFAGLAWRLHPTSAVASFAARAAEVTLDDASRLQALDALAFIAERPAAEAMANLALTADGEVGQRATWWIRHRDTNDWRAFDLADELRVGDLSKAELVFESGVIRSGRHAVRVDLRGAERLWLVATDAGDGNSCDWADWIEPVLMTDEGERPLTDLAWASAEAAWGEVHVSKNAVGEAMRVAGEEVAWGIGTHAESRVEFVVPAGATEVRCWVGPDEGGTSQNGGGTTSIEFRVYVERPRNRTQLTDQAAIALDAHQSEAARAEAVGWLATDAEGGLLLIRAARAGELPEPLLEVAAESIFDNPDLSVRALASEVFTRPGEALGGLPPIGELLALEGDAVAGRKLFQSATALCSTCHTFDGLGREIGPDLTAIRTKYGRAELLDAILNPSAGIAFGYDSWVFEVDGVGWLSGFVLADGEVIVLKDSAGLRHVIAREDVLFRERQSLSVMPTGLALGLGGQGLADLLACLTEDTSAEPIFGDEQVLFDGTSLDAWGFHLVDPDATLEDVWSIEPGGVLRCVGNPVGYLFTRAEFRDFELELEWRFDPERGAGNSGVLLRLVGEDKVWPKSIEAQLHSRNAGDIWNIDGVGMLVDPARTSGRRTQKLAPSSELPLGEWNHYRIRLDRGSLRLFVNGVLQNEARWCEEVSGRIGLQSEGAEIQFRNVRLRPIVGHVQGD